METIKKRSESPSVKKGKVQEVSSFENIEEITEQVKTKKKNLRSKQKTQVNGKNNGDSLNAVNKNESNKKESNAKSPEKNGQDATKKDVPPAANNVDSVKENLESKNNNEKIEESVTKDVITESPTNSENHTVSKSEIQDVGKEHKDGNYFCSSTTSTETENGANNTSNGLNDSTNVENTCLNKTSESENAVTDTLNSSKNSDTCEVSVTPVNGESIPDLSSTKGSEKNAIDSDEDSFYEVVVESSKDKQCIASSDAINNDEKSVVMSNTCSSVTIDRKSSSPANKEKQNSEISSSKKINDSPMSKMDGKSYIHPYLGKISGRPGIRRGSNLLDVSTNGHDVFTPQNKGPSLSDSFRVKSDPPRLNQVDTPENLGLKKYKGKRCLNINDDFDYDDDAFAVKRQKLDDKQINKTGFLGSVLWSPFKKKHSLHLVDDETTRLSETQSKLSKFLSPFWFWKKTTINERN